MSLSAEMMSTPGVLAPRNKRKTRSAVFGRDGNLCVWCSKNLCHQTATLDHVVVQLHGGSWWEGNLLPACSECNTERGSRDLEEWIARQRKKGRKLREPVLAAALERLKDPRCYWQQQLMLDHGFTQDQIHDMMVWQRDKILHMRVHQARRRMRSIARGVKMEIFDPPRFGQPRLTAGSLA